MQISFIICLERDSNSKVGIGMVRRVCFCSDASFLSFAIDVLRHLILP